MSIFCRLWNDFEVCVNLFVDAAEFFETFSNFTKFKVKTFYLFAFRYHTTLARLSYQLPLSLISKRVQRLRAFLNRITRNQTNDNKRSTSSQKLMKIFLRKKEGFASSRSEGRTERTCDEAKLPRLNKQLRNEYKFTLIIKNQQTREMT